MRKRYTKKDYTKNGYTKKHYTKKRYTKKRYTKKRQNNKVQYRLSKIKRQNYYLVGGGKFVVRVLLSVRCHEHCTHTRRHKSGWRKLDAALGLS